MKNRFTIFDMLENQPVNIFRRPKTWGRPIPRGEWEKGEFYRNMQNTVWLEITESRFPATVCQNKATHTLYVLDVTEYGIRICPTSTQYQYKRPCHLIRKGMRLEGSDKDLKKDVYVITLLEYSVPEEKIAGEEDLYYAGRYPLTAMQELD